jgi:outer membrane protein assembly factor BamB
MSAGRTESAAVGRVPSWVAIVVVVAGVASVGQRTVAAFDDRTGPPLPAQPDPVPVASPINEAFAGLTTFRGNAARSLSGEGPVPRAPTIQWIAPSDGTKMCAFSAEGLDPTDTKEWCGTGWTGQPNVVSKPGAAAEIRVGTYDRNYHFWDATTGVPVRPDLVTGDLAKGSATTDPDNYPLYYAGSRDNFLRVVALDREVPTVLWQIGPDSVPRPLWNDDWDGAPLIVGDYLLEGGENSWLYVIRLNRGFDGHGKVTVAPEIVATIPGFDEQLLQDIGDTNVSIESSVAFRGGVAYFANGGGLVQGWDISDVLAGGSEFHQVFRFWTGDDTDATVVIDDEGALYVASQFQRFSDRAREVGQLMKLDPTKPDDPLVWSIPATEIGFEGAGGSWSTPALYGEYVFFTTAAGRMLAVDRDDGKVAWELQIAAPSIGSPVVVDDVLIQGDCSGHLLAWDVSNPAFPPPLLWSVDLGDCIESTPAVWGGWIYVGTREGYFYGLADAPSPPP